MDIKGLSERVIKWLITIVFYILRIFPIDNNKIVFSNFNGKGYGDNPKYISEILKCDLAYKLIWLCDNIDSDFPNEILPVKRFSLRGFYELVTARIWVDNSRKGYYVRKRKNQFYIQTWHGGEGLKKCENDCVNALPLSWIKASKNDSSMIDVLISNSKFNTDLFRRAFWYSGEILEYGSPRNDILYRTDKHTQIRNKVFESLNILDECKLILYAPTFRDDDDYSIYNLDYNMVIREFGLYFSTKYKMIIKLHPKMDLSKFKVKYCDNIIDASSYPDLYELMIACDVMISDYSSCMFEMGYMNKLVFIYANDYKVYSDKRGFLFNLEDLPYKLAVSNQELTSCIRNLDIREYHRELSEFNKKLGIITDGQGSERVAKLIKNIINK